MNNCKISFLAFFLIVGIIGCKSSKKKNGTNPTVHATDKSEQAFLKPFIGKKSFKMSPETFSENIIINKSENYERMGLSIWLNPSSFKSWEECLKKNKGKKLFLLSPGDYRNWGNFKPTFSGNKDQPIILSRENVKNKTHPYKLKGSNNEVVLKAIKLSNTSYWIFNGLSIKGNDTPYKHKGIKYIGGSSNSFVESHHNVFNRCYVENVVTPGAIKIYNSSFNTIQNSVFSQEKLIPSDITAFLLIAEEGISTRGNKILNNEIINWNDGIHTLRQILPGLKKQRTGDFPATIIENNDIYITPLLHRKKGTEMLACAENAIDLKVGTYSSKKEDVFIVKNNRMWGFRYSDKSCGPSGSSGEAMVIHRVAANILLEGNIIFDCPQGIAIRSGNPADKDSGRKMEKITLKNNIIFDINKTDNDKFSGTGLYISAPTKIENNIFGKCETPFYIALSSDKSTFNNNLFYDAKNITWLSYNGNKKTRLRENIFVNIKKVDQELIYKTGRHTQDLNFVVKQWSGKKSKTLKVKLP